MQTTTSTGDIGRRELLLDAAMAVGLAVLAAAMVALYPFVVRHAPGPPPPHAGPREFREFASAVPTALSCALAALTFLPLAGRRRYPVIVLGVVAIISGVYGRIPQPPAFTMLAPLIALYTVATLRDRRTSITSFAAVAALTLGFVVRDWSGTAWLGDVISISALFAFAAALGDATRNRRAYVAEVEARAIEAERTREEEALRRVEEERLRIARELHDVTAHSLSIIAVQAGAAERVVESDPTTARESLDAIRRTAKASLDELRSMLGVLRGGEEAPLAPTGTVARLPELARSIEQAGVAVELRVGDVGEIPAFVDVSAYRIVQEALTNVVRHAHASKAVVDVARDLDALVLSVTDDGVGSRVAVPGGHGIPGMRERAAALGGTFAAGPAAGGGFAVHATLPFESKAGSR